MNRFTNIRTAIEHLTDKAVQQISIEFVVCDRHGAASKKPGVVSQIIRAVQDDLETITTAAIPAQTLHAAILEKLIVVGIAKRVGPAIIAA